MQPEIEHVSVGEPSSPRRIAVLRRTGRTPGLFWLGGFRSEMTGGKASAIDALGAETGLCVTRFDYSGHGASDGAFEDGTVSDWLADAIAVFRSTDGPQIVVGSSMGGWMALLLNRALQSEELTGRIKAMVLVAPAVDMTEELMRAGLSAQDVQSLQTRGRIERASAYSDTPDILTEKLLADGAKHLLLGSGTISTGCPVAILQGGQDDVVPVAHALRLVTHLTRDPVGFTLIPDGDHRLSRPQDLAKLRQVVLGFVNLS